MLNQLQTWFSWLPWVGAGGAGLLGAAWFFGLMPVIGAVVKVLAEVLTPILRAVVEGVVWLWQNVFWPGLKDILDDWVTIATVLTLAACGWIYMEGQAAVQKATLRTEVAEVRQAFGQCSKDLRALKATAKRLGQPPAEPFWKW